MLKIDWSFFFGDVNLWDFLEFIVRMGFGYEFVFVVEGVECYD